MLEDLLIRPLKNKIFKYDFSNKNVYIEKLDDIVNKYSNTYHRQNEVDANPNTYTDFHVENNDKDPKFKTGDQVRISKDKRTFVKDYTPKLIRRSFCY